MSLCTDQELAASLDRLNRAFKDRHLTIGCRLEVGLNIIRSALTHFEPRELANVSVYLQDELFAATTPHPLPEPTAPSSRAIH